MTSGRFRTSFWPTVRESDGRVGLDERRVGDDGDDLLDAARLDGGVDAGVAAHLEQDAGLREVLEAGQRDLELVVADGQQPQGVLALGVGRRGARELRAQVGGGDLRGRHRRPRAVLDVAQDGPGRDLGLRRRRSGASAPTSPATIRETPMRRRGSLRPVSFIGPPRGACGDGLGARRRRFCLLNGNIANRKLLSRIFLIPPRGLRHVDVDTADTTAYIVPPTVKFLCHQGARAGG